VPEWGNEVTDQAMGYRAKASARSLTVHDTEGSSYGWDHDIYRKQNRRKLLGFLATGDQKDYADVTSGSFIHQPFAGFAHKACTSISFLV
jgi:hypothetical protein